jgi:hypothetical protein
MDDTDRVGKTIASRPLSDNQSILRILQFSPQNRIDVHVELRVIPQVAKLDVQDLEALLGNIIRLDIVHTDLEMIQPGFIQSFDPLWSQQITVGQYSRQHPMTTDSGDDLLNLRMKQGLASAQVNHSGTEFGQVINPSQQIVDGDRRGMVVELIAVGTSKITAPDRYQMSKNRVLGRLQTFGKEVCLPHFAMNLKIPLSHVQESFFRLTT